MAELAVRDGFPPPPGLPRGQVIYTDMEDGSIRIIHAPPRILISAELLDTIAHGGSPWAALDPLGGCDLTYVGGVLKIHGVNRTVVYRITDYVLRVNAMVGEWPD